MANSSNRGGSRPGAGRKKKNPDGTYEHAAFSAEQLKELTDSPHVAYVSSKTVSYTKAFKDAAWQRYCDGVDPIQIFSEVGLNPETLHIFRDRYTEIAANELTIIHTSV